MNWHSLPSLSSLRAFLAVADLGGYSRAAAALSVSHAAVHQHVKALEQRLGLALVRREGRRSRLTADGEVLARHLALGFGAIRDGVEALCETGTTRPVQITMPPAFAVSWLMPRIMDFQQTHPGVTLMLNTTAELLEFTPGGLDLAIRFGGGHWPGLEARLFLHPDLVVVGARSLIEGRPPGHLSALAELPWLQELGSDDVARWMARHGVRPQRPVRITHMPGNLIMEALRRGDGLSFTARCFVDQDIQSGRLLEFTSERDAGAYFIVTRPGVQRAPVVKLIRWLQRQAVSN